MLKVVKTMSGIITKILQNHVIKNLSLTKEQTGEYVIIQVCYAGVVCFHVRIKGEL